MSANSSIKGNHPGPHDSTAKGNGGTSKSGRLRDGRTGDQIPRRSAHPGAWSAAPAQSDSGRQAAQEVLRDAAREFAPGNADGLSDPERLVWMLQRAFAKGEQNNRNRSSMNAPGPVSDQR